jgi:hypothetical protein
MTCFVSRVRATRCGRSAGLSRRGPLDFCPKEDKLTPYKALARWNYWEPHQPSSLPDGATSRAWMLGDGRCAMGRRVCAREKRSCTLGKGGKCFEDRIMEGRSCCRWAWEQWLGFCQVGGKCTCEVGLVRPYPSSASPELHGDTHRYTFDWTHHRPVGDERTTIPSEGRYRTVRRSPASAPTVRRYRPH